MLKRGLICLLTLALVTPLLMAQQKGRVPVREQCFKEAMDKHADELKQGESSSHGGSIDGTWHADLWHFWSVEKGTGPEDFELKPMVFDNETRYGGPRGWKGIFAHSLEGNKRYFYPITSGKTVMMKKGAKSPGAGISIRNPLDKPVKVHLEGMIRLYLPTDLQTVWVYKKTDDGVDVLTSTEKEGAVATGVRLRGNKGPERTYLKLLEETTLQPGQHIYIVGLTDIAKAVAAQPEKKRTKAFGMFSVDCPWGKPYKMHVFIEPVTP